MGAEETELEMVRRHVREGGEHLANQRALIARLRAAHLPTEEAEGLLDTFEELQRQHRAHLARIEGKRDDTPPPDLITAGGAQCRSSRPGPVRDAAGETGWGEGG